MYIYNVLHIYVIHIYMCVLPQNISYVKKSTVPLNCKKTVENKGEVNVRQKLDNNVGLILTLQVFNLLQFNISGW